MHTMRTGACVCTHMRTGACVCSHAQTAAPAPPTAGGVRAEATGHGDTRAPPLHFSAVVLADIGALHDIKSVRGARPSLDAGELRTQP